MKKWMVKGNNYNMVQVEDVFNPISYSYYLPILMMTNGNKQGFGTVKLREKNISFFFNSFKNLFLLLIG